MPGDPYLPPGCTQKMIDAHFGNDSELCTECNGEKFIFKSNCCEANFFLPGWPDSDVCSKCMEHAEPIPCDHCNGTGDEPVKEPDFDDQDED